MCVCKCSCCYCIRYELYIATPDYSKYFNDFEIRSHCSISKRSYVRFWYELNTSLSQNSTNTTQQISETFSRFVSFSRHSMFIYELIDCSRWSETTPQFTELVYRLNTLFTHRIQTPIAPTSEASEMPSKVPVLTTHQTSSFIIVASRLSIFFGKYFPHICRSISASMSRFKRIFRRVFSISIICELLIPKSIVIWSVADFYHRINHNLIESVGFSLITI